MKLLFINLFLILSLSPFLADAQTALLVFAHPDDETMMANTIAKLKRASYQVHAIYLTRGEGGWNQLWLDELKRLSPQDLLATAKSPDELLEGFTNRGLTLPTEPDLGALRLIEMRNAAGVLGLNSHRVYGFPDEWDNIANKGSVENWDVVKISKKIMDFAKLVQPDLIFTLSPADKFVHAHHQLTGQIVSSLYQQNKLGRRARSLFAVEETDWYAKHNYENDFGGERIAARRSGTDRAFQQLVSAQHRSQAISRQGLGSRTQESFKLLAGSSENLKNVLHSKVTMLCKSLFN